MEGDRNLHGTTWDIYLCLLTSKKPMGARDIWRKLHLSSPSLAQYHINKLSELDLITPVLGGKYIIKGGTQEVLKGFFMLRGRLIPRLVIYSAFLLGMLITYLSFWPFRGDFRDLFTIAVCLLGILAFLYEACSQYRYLRRIGKQN